MSFTNNHIRSYYKKDHKEYKDNAVQSSTRSVLPERGFTGTSLNPCFSSIGGVSNVNMFFSYGLKEFEKNRISTNKEYKSITSLRFTVNSANDQSDSSLKHLLDKLGAPKSPAAVGYQNHKIAPCRSRSAEYIKEPPRLNKVNSVSTFFIQRTPSTPLQCGYIKYNKQPKVDSMKQNKVLKMENHYLKNELVNMRAEIGQHLERVTAVAKIQVEHEKLKRKQLKKDNIALLNFLNEIRENNKTEKDSLRKQIGYAQAVIEDTRKMQQGLQEDVGSLVLKLNHLDTEFHDFKNKENQTVQQLSAALKRKALDEKKIHDNDEHLGIIARKLSTVLKKIESNNNQKLTEMLLSEELTI